MVYIQTKDAQIYVTFYSDSNKLCRLSLILFKEFVIADFLIELVLLRIIKFRSFLVLKELKQK